MSEDELEVVPGLLIAVTIGFVSTVLSLSVIWRGDGSQTAAGFWPAAGVPLVAMILLPFRRWGWVVAGLIPPTIVAIVCFDALIGASLWWFVGNCAEPAIRAACCISANRRSG